jgi:hypothetical protein
MQGEQIPTPLASIETVHTRNPDAGILIATFSFAGDHFALVVGFAAIALMRLIVQDNDILLAA